MPTHSRIQISLRGAVPSIALCVKAVALALALTIPPSMARAEMTLLMFEERGCVWCARWTEDVGGEYPITPEGQAAPLRRIMIHEPLPEGIELVSRPRFTPTFVVVEDGVEIGRIEGYPGEDFFWGLLGQILDRAAPAG